MEKEYKYGVCRYNFSSYEPKVESLLIFDSYQRAYNHYIKRAFDKDKYNTPSDLWIVFIDPKENRIIQFERLERKIISRQVKLP